MENSKRSGVERLFHDEQMRRDLSRGEPSPIHSKVDRLGGGSRRLRRGRSEVRSNQKIRSEEPKNSPTPVSSYFLKLSKSKTIFQFLLINT